MASPGGTSSGSSALLQQVSSPEQEKLLHTIKIDERKRKRMESNRESARRSRMRKQQHLDELMAQVAHLRKENSDLVTKMSLTTEKYLNIEAENSVLRAQVAELSSRLQSLDEIIHLLDATSHATAGVFGAAEDSFQLLNDFLVGGGGGGGGADCFMIGPWGSLGMNQPIMANADMFQH